MILICFQFRTIPPPSISLAREPTPSKGSPARARFDKLDDNAHILHVNFRKCQTEAKMSLGEIFIMKVLDIKQCAESSHLHNFIWSFLQYNIVDRRPFLHDRRWRCETTSTPGEGNPSVCKNSTFPLSVCLTWPWFLTKPLRVTESLSSLRKD